MVPVESTQLHECRFKSSNTDEGNILKSETHHPSNLFFFLDTLLMLLSLESTTDFC